MQPTPTHPMLHERLRTLRRYRLLVVTVAIVAAGVALVLSLRQDEEFQATAQLTFRDVTQDLNVVGNFAQLTNTPAQLAAASAAILERPEIIARTRSLLGTRRSAGDLRDLISASADPRSNLVAVVAKGPSGEFAAELANTVARVARTESNQQSRRRFRLAARSLRSRYRGLDSEERDTSGVEVLRQLTAAQALARFASSAEIAEPARVPSSPSSPKPIRNTIIGAVLGLLVGLVLAFFLHSLDRRLRNSHEVQGHLDLPLLGHVREEMMGRAAYPSGAHSAHNDVESFQILRANLTFLDIDTPMRSVVVTSALPQEGKSTVAASLALASAAVGNRTLLVECDLRRPALAGRLGLQSGPGLTDYLVGDADPQTILQMIPVHRGSANGDAPGHEPEGTQSSDVLVCITAGSENPRAGELLASNRFKDFLEEVSSAYDLVVIDTAPLLSVADTLTLAPLVDRVLLCVRSSQTTRDQAMAGKAALDRITPPPIGLVVTGERAREESDYGYYHSYSYTYGETATKA